MQKADRTLISPHALTHSCFPTILSVISRDSLQQNCCFHKHDDFCEIIYIEKGSSIMFVDNQKYEVSDGDFIVHNRGVMHAELSDPAVNMRKLIICIDNVNLSGLSENCIIPDWMHPVIKNGKASQDIKYLFKKILLELSARKSGYVQVCQGMLLSILALIHRNYSISTSPPVSNTNTMRETIIQIKQYIDQNFHKNITLESISNKFFFSTYYLSHIMKDELGYSPMSYVMHLRINEAQRLLLSADYPISQIAKQVGYNSASYFTSIFKRHTGKTPSEFRKTYRIFLDNPNTFFIQNNKQHDRTSASGQKEP